MKKIVILLVLLIPGLLHAQQQTKNIIIITTDGFRWQEIFGGMDTALANNHQFNEGDSNYIYEQYWDDDLIKRREKLMPFLWQQLVKKGQLFGNRTAGVKVDVSNPYWFSYPGYSEIMTGYADTAINSNGYPPNPNKTVLEFFNQQPGLKGRVAAFGAWEAFDRILNEQRSHIPVMSAFDTIPGEKLTAKQQLFNKMLLESYKPWLKDECLDVFTHTAAMDYLQTKKPKVMYISYGETDEWAHAGKYRSYLDAGHQVDAWLKEIWNFVQSDPQYRNQTTIFITTDHGRGNNKKEEWTSHGSDISDSHEIWFGVMGPDTPVRGELKTPLQLYQEQFAQTFAKLLGLTYTATHPVANPILYVLKMKK